MDYHAETIKNAAVCMYVCVCVQYHAETIKNAAVCMYVCVCAVSC